MPLTPQQVEALVDANAAALGVPIAAEHRKGVLMFMGLAAGMADQVFGLPLTPADESGSLFAPVEPDLPEDA